jgi:uncharacterized protein GlcG (DUF336 family)
MYRRITIAALLAGAAYSAHAQQAVFETRSLTPETALAAAQAALESCRKAGYQVSVAVVDRSGLPQVLLRDRYATAHTVDIALDKAWTAASFKIPTAALAAETQAGKPMSGLRGHAREPASRRLPTRWSFEPPAGGCATLSMAALCEGSTHSTSIPGPGLTSWPDGHQCGYTFSGSSGRNSAWTPRTHRHPRRRHARNPAVCRVDVLTAARCRCRRHGLLAEIGALHRGFPAGRLDGHSRPTPGTRPHRLLQAAVSRR